MECVDFLLTDEFIEFSKKIEGLAAKKKELKVQLKEYYDGINVQIKDLENQAKVAQQEFEDWKQSKQKSN